MTGRVVPYRGLARGGHASLHTVEAALIAHPDTPSRMRVFWAKEHEFNRDTPALSAMAAQLVLGQEQLDDLFRAAQIVV